MSEDLQKDNDLELLEKEEELIKLRLEELEKITQSIKNKKKLNHSQTEHQESPPKPMINNYQDEEEQNPFKPSKAEEIDMKLKKLQEDQKDGLEQKANAILMKLQGQYCSFK